MLNVEESDLDKGNSVVCLLKKRELSCLEVKLATKVASWLQRETKGNTEGVGTLWYATLKCIYSIVLEERYE